MTNVAALQPGQPVEGVYAVRRKERRLTRQGAPYLALTLADAAPGRAAGRGFSLKGIA